MVQASSSVTRPADDLTEESWGERLVWRRLGPAHAIPVIQHELRDEVGGVVEVAIVDCAPLADEHLVHSL
eukprot:13008506-Alexandrium_andersonii.AAC.1